MTADTPRLATGPVYDLHTGRPVHGAQFLSLPLPALAAAIGGLMETQGDEFGSYMDTSPGATDQHRAHEHTASAFDPTESARYLEVRDALAHHLREGASAAEAVDTVLLILDPESLRQMAAVGLRLVLNELTKLPAASTDEGG